MYKIGCADGAITGSNGTSLRGPCTCCSNGTTDPNGNCPAPTQKYEQTCQNVLFAETLDGPWELVDLRMPGWDWRDLNLGLESHAPVVLDNGTVLTATRSWGTPAPYPNSALWLIRAHGGWDGDYELVSRAWAAQPMLPVQMEDSFMYRGELGHFHALFHIWSDDGNVGAHAFSRDGLHWQLSQTRPYSVVVNTTSTDGGNGDGEAVVYGRRERPHLVLDGQRRPTHLLTAVQYGPLPGDFSHTHVQAVRV